MDKDSADVHQELIKLKSKIQEARDQISTMPGIDVSPAVQQQQLLTTVFVYIWRQSHNQGRFMRGL